MGTIKEWRVKKGHTYNRAVYQLLRIAGEQSDKANRMKQWSLDRINRYFMSKVENLYHFERGMKVIHQNGSLQVVTVVEVKDHLLVVNNGTKNFEVYKSSVKKISNHNYLSVGGYGE